VNERLSNLLIALIIVSIVMILTGILLTLVNFYNDYQCSTTTDIKWYIENDCMRFMED